MTGNEVTKLGCDCGNQICEQNIKSTNESARAFLGINKAVVIIGNFRNLVNLGTLILFYCWFGRLYLTYCDFRNIKADNLEVF